MLARRAPIAKRAIFGTHSFVSGRTSVFPGLPPREFSRHIADEAFDLRLRHGWLHDCSAGLKDTATFSGIPGASFTVFGASPPKDRARNRGHRGGSRQPRPLAQCRRRAFEYQPEFGRQRRHGLPLVAVAEVSLANPRLQIKAATPWGIGWLTVRSCAAAKDGGPGPSRTVTSLSGLRILSPLRLPIPPRGLLETAAVGSGASSEAASALRTARAPPRCPIGLLGWCGKWLRSRHSKTPTL
jgi:hypothetical protein